MNVCTMPECQTSAGCKCGSRPMIRSLADFSDEEIAREYHWRSLRKLGDQRIGITLSPNTAPTTTRWPTS